MNAKEKLLALRNKLLSFTSFSRDNEFDTSLDEHQIGNQKIGLAGHLCYQRG